MRQNNTRMKLFFRFGRSARGSVMTLTALLLVPLLIFVGLAIDYSRAIDARSRMQAAADAAVLAAAKASSEDTDAVRSRELISKYLATALRNAAGLRDVHYTLDAERGLLRLVLGGKVRTTVSRVFTPALSVEVKAAARTMTETNPLCLLARSPGENEAFKVWGSARIDGPDCAMVSNSTSARSMVSGGAAHATAAEFCAAGGSSGEGFTPPVETQCPPAPDPYDGKYTARQIKSETRIDIVAAPCDQSAPVKVKDDMHFSAGPRGVYVFCEGLSVTSGATVTLGPGLYVFNNALQIRGGGRLLAREGTTIYLADQDRMCGAQQGYIDIAGGGTLDIVAPASGYFAGAAVLQPVVSGFGSNSAKFRVANGVGLSGNGRVDITGLMYMPQSSVSITGTGVFNQVSPYFTLIADTIEVQGNGTINVRSDARAAGFDLPPQVSSIGAVTLTE